MQKTDNLNKQANKNRQQQSKKLNLCGKILIFLVIGTFISIMWLIILIYNGQTNRGTDLYLSLAVSFFALMDLIFAFKAFKLSQLMQTKK